jgi:hypothetical protein
MSRNGNRPGHHEYIIVGAGPAGAVTLGQLAEHAG